MEDRKLPYLDNSKYGHAFLYKDPGCMFEKYLDSFFMQHDVYLFRLQT